MEMNINGIAYGPPQTILPSRAIQQPGSVPAGAPAVQESAPVELSPIGSVASGPTGFAKTGIAAYSSIAA
jgi:hypothetical protein